MTPLQDCVVCGKPVSLRSPDPECHAHCQRERAEKVDAIRRAADRAAVEEARAALEEGR